MLYNHGEANFLPDKCSKDIFGLNGISYNPETYNSTFNKLNMSKINTKQSFTIAFLHPWSTQT